MTSCAAPGANVQCPNAPVGLDNGSSIPFRVLIAKIVSLILVFPVCECRGSRLIEFATAMIHGITQSNAKVRSCLTRPAAATKWRDALRSRPLALGTRPRRSVALQIFWKHERKTRTSYAVRTLYTRDQAQRLRYSQATITCVPGPTPSRRAALSPTKANSSLPAELISATSIPLGCSA
jgi:hypothetical protein